MSGDWRDRDGHHVKGARFMSAGNDLFFHEDVSSSSEVSAGSKISLRL